MQGLNKDKTREKFGKEQVHLWRRSYDVKPPNGESLKDTCERTIPYYKKYINNAITQCCGNGNLFEVAEKAIWPSDSKWRQKPNDNEEREKLNDLINASVICPIIST